MEGTREQSGFVRLHAREGEERAVEEALRDVLGPKREEAGCLNIHAFHSIRDQRLFLIHSRCVHEAAFRGAWEIATYAAIS